MANFLRPSRKSATRPTNKRRRIFETLERRQLLAGDVTLFADGFEAGQWNGKWVEDSQNDWFPSSQRSTDGSFSAEVDGRATDATLTLSDPIDLSGYSSATLTFDWLIEKGFDSGEYLALDISSNGGASWQTDVLRLNGNSSQENTWHNETVDLTPFASSNLLLRFRAQVSRSNEDANVDNVKIVGTLAGPPEISISSTAVTEGADTLRRLDTFVSEGSGGLTRPRNLIFGPDGNLYVGSVDTSEVLRYDGQTGAFIDTFVASGGALQEPAGLQFSPLNGHLYVADVATNQIHRFDGQTGAHIDSPVSGLARPLGITFASSGSLLIANRDTDEVLLYDGSSVSSFVTTGSGGLDEPRNAVFGPDGMLYVSSEHTQQVLRYDGTTGVFVDVFATTNLGFNSPNWIEFGTDGILYASSRTVDACCDRSLIRFDAATGALIDTFDGGQDGWSFTLGPDNLIYNAGNSFGNVVSRVGPESTAAFVVSLSTPSATAVTVDYATSDGSATAGSDYGQVSGTLVFEPGTRAQAIIVPTFDDGLSESDETFEVTLTSPVGATLLNTSADGTIVDDDSNNDPVAVNDLASSQSQIEQTVDVLANDSDSDGDLIVIQSVQSPTTGGGTVAIHPDNTLGYTSAAGFTGSDTFTYTISDGQGGTATATVTVDVTGSSNTVMYVADISFQSRRGGKHWRAIFEVHDESGAPVSDASITVTFAGRSFSGLTNGSGQLRTNWLRLSRGSYEAEVTDLVLANYTWDLTQGVPDSNDADPYPDRLLTF